MYSCIQFDFQLSFIYLSVIVLLLLFTCLSLYLSIEIKQNWILFKFMLQIKKSSDQVR